MADKSLFNYPGMLNAADFFEAKGVQIEDLIKDIRTRNEQLVSSEWNGDSALAFQDRFDNDHAVKLMAIKEALDEIAKTIRGLVDSRIAWEKEQAGKFGG